MSDEKITEWNRATSRALVDAMNEALAPVAERFGVTLKLGGGTMYPAEGLFRPKFEAQLGDADKRTWDALCGQLWPALEPDDFGRAITVQGRTFTLCGINPKARKRPVLATGDDGKTYTFPEASVVVALGRAAR